MTDPLSIALAAISVATVLKGIVELAKTLNESFKKPGRNMRRVESLAAETLGIVKDLQKFYDGHKEILDSAPDMQDAVLRLLKCIFNIANRAFLLTSPGLVAASPTFEAQIQLANLVRYSSYVARRNGDLENATRDAEEAVQTYERLIGNTTSAPQMEVNIINKMSGPTAMTLEATRVCEFADAFNSAKTRQGNDTTCWY